MAAVGTASIGNDGTTTGRRASGSAGSNIAAPADVAHDSRQVEDADEEEVGDDDGRGVVTRFR